MNALRNDMEDYVDSMKAEYAVLACVLNNPEEMARVKSCIATDDLAEPECRQVYRAMLSLHAKDSPINMMTVQREMAKAGIGVDVAWLALLNDSYYIRSAIQTELDYIVDRSRIRKLARLDGESIVEECASNPDAVVRHIEQFLEPLKTRKSAEIELGLGLNIDYAWERVDERRLRGTHITGVETGYHELDMLTCGLQSGELIIIAARPSMGKSALMANLAWNARKSCPLIFSCEMSKSSLIERLIALKTDIPLRSLKSGDVSEDQYQIYVEKYPELAEAQITIIDDMNALSQFESVLMRLKAAGKLPGIVFIDHLSHVILEQGRIEVDSFKRQAEIGLITKRLCTLAKKLGICFVLLCQLNRQLSARAEKRPILSDLRSSGEIEQDADTVIFIHRDDYADFNRGKEKECTNRGTAELIVAKQRNGEVGTAHVLFRPETGVFIDTQEAQQARFAGRSAPTHHYVQD